MKAIPPWVTYTVYRILLFAVPLAVLLLLRVEWLFSVIAAAVIGLCTSYIVLRRPRARMAKDLYDIRHGNKRPPIVDEENEDAADDAERLEGERPADQ